MRKLILIAGGALLFYVVIVMAIAVIPAIQLSQVPPGPGVVDLTPLQAEGRRVFAANGCSYCHTQQVRPLEQDQVFGRPSAPGDFAWQTPELLGSERTGPDLSNVGKTRGSEVWQYIHLWNPRAVVPESIMPDFRYLFRVLDKAPAGETPVPVPPQFAPTDGVVVPGPEARALVAYLLSLEQTPIPGHDMGSAVHAAGGSTRASPPESNAPPAPASASAEPSAPPATGGYVFDAAKGRALYLSTCAACHQESGAGLPGAFPPLRGNAVVAGDDPAQHIRTILFGAHDLAIDGVKYPSPMPPFAAQLDDDEVAAIINHERSSWGNEARQVTPADVSAVRKQGS